MDIKQLKRDGDLLSKFEFIYVVPINNDKSKARIILCMKGDRSETSHNIFKTKKFKGSLFDIRRMALKENETPKEWLRVYSDKILKAVREELTMKNISEEDFLIDNYDKNIPLIFNDVNL